MTDLQSSIAHLDKATSNYDPRFTLKVLRQLPQLHRNLDTATLASTISEVYGSSPVSAALGKVLGETIPEATSRDPSPEVDIFMHLLVQVWAQSNADPSQFLEAGDLALDRLQQYNRRSLDYLEAKVWFYYVRAAEIEGELGSVHGDLMSALRTATLRHDDETTAMLIVLLIRVLLLQKKVSQAANLVSKTTFPESASNSLVARYMYYLSRINAVQLDYSTAFTQITAAIRKVPQTQSALGFLQSAHKLSVLIELLMGEIPDREIFKKLEFAKPLEPYFALARAVRSGNVETFSQTLKANEEALKRDNNYIMAHRLRQNVIKTGIRVISLTYARISLRDMCVKLNLDSEESAEYIVAKAIRDGVIDAEIIHQKGYMQSKETLDIYSTTEPQQAFHDRIQFCMTLHDDSVKAMRYLNNDHRDDLKDAEEAREREKELVTEIQEGTDLEDYDGDFEM